MAIDTRDDGFHEIQLNGKQLVFLFMAATVVSVVIFLCGVLVGRGVGASRATMLEAAGIGDEAAAGAATDQAPESASATEGPAAEPTARELDYFERLKSPTPAAEALKPVPVPGPPAAPEPATVAARPPTAPPAATPPAQASANTASTAPGPAAPRATTDATPPAPPPARAIPAAGGEWAVQIAALNDSDDADAMARVWGAKGYDAYVVTPAPGAPAVYRVRIGTFDTRREADALAAKLQKEERISPWVTR